MAMVGIKNAIFVSWQILIAIIIILPLTGAVAIENDAVAADSSNKKESEEFRLYKKQYRFDLKAARDLMADSKCALQGTIAKDGSLIEDLECIAAKDAINEKNEATKRIELIENLNTNRAKIIALVKAESEKDKYRYSEYILTFETKPKEAQRFLNSCVDNEEVVKKKPGECLAAVDIKIKNLYQIHEAHLQELLIDSKEDDKYTSEFKANKEAIEVILDKKCAILFSNPWYENSSESQEKECDYLEENKKQINKMKKFVSIEKEEINHKNFDYYIKHINIAKSDLLKCEKGDDILEPKNCQDAAKAIDKVSSDRDIRKSFLSNFRKNLLKARDYLNKCNAGEVQDPIKCETALIAINEDIKHRKRNEEFNSYIKIYKADLVKAKSFVEKECRGVSVAFEDDIIQRDSRCLAAKKALQDDAFFKSRDELIKKLQKQGEEMKLSTIFENEADLTRYKKYRQDFKKNKNIAKDFLLECIESPKRLQQSDVECLASIDVMIEHLEIARKEDIAKSKNYDGYNAYYQRFLQSSKNEVDKLLDGKCKIIFSDPWYEYDPYVWDEQCDAALLEKRRATRNKQFEKQKKTKEDIRDIKYYQENLTEAQKLSDKCANGTVVNLSNCEMALKIIEEKEQAKAELEKHKIYYANHILAAKYKLKWCESVMANFSDECKIVEKVLDGHKDKVLSDEKYNNYYDFFVKSPFEAGIVAKGECKERLADSWYFLDVNMQSEKCTAARDVVN